MPTLFEFAGGEAGLHRLEQVFYDSVLAALDRAGMPTDPAFREAVREHLEFVTKVAMQNSHATTDDELHPLRQVPRWTWPGDSEEGSSRGSAES